MFFKLVEKKDVIIVLKKDNLFIIAPVIYVIIGVGIDFHYNKFTKFLKLRKLLSAGFRFDL